MLSGHKEPITSVSIHPSGKLALSVSKDNTMKLWNLVQGTYSTFRSIHEIRISLNISVSNTPIGCHKFFASAATRRSLLIYS